MKSSKTTPSSGSGPINYILNGTVTAVNKDTTTPANTKPLPVEFINSSGVAADVATAANQALQLAQETAIATSNAAIQTSASSIDTKLTNVATTALQTAGNTSLASIDGKVLTDAQLRATPVPVSGPLTDAQLRATAVPVSGPLTDTQLRATAVPVSGTVTSNQGSANVTPWNVAVSNFPATQPVSGTVAVSNFPATQPVSAAALPLPTGAATETTLSALNIKIPAQGQALAAASIPVVLPAAQITALTPPTTVTSATPTGTLTDRSGTTSATPLTSTTLAAVNGTRKYLFIENNSTAGDIYINFTSAATALNSVVLKPFATYEMNGNFVSTELVSVASNVASATFSAKEA